MKQNFSLLCLLIILLFSCTQEMIENKNLNDSSAVEFNNPQELLETFDYLSKLSRTELLEWVRNNSAQSVLNSNISINDTLFKATPLSFQALFNRDLEVRIGEDIVKFCDGSLFVVTYENGEIATKTPYGFAKYENDLSPTTRGELGAQEKESSIQHGFRINATDYQYKYVVQVRSFVVNLGGQANRYVLTLDVKMEYRKRGSWKPAGRKRFVSVRVGGTYTRGSVSGNFDVTKDDYWEDGFASYVLASIDATGPIPGGVFWKYYPRPTPYINTVFQRIEGSPESAYTMNITF